MSNAIKYHVAGRFEGQFKTLQDLALKCGEPFPEGSEHLIRIYRGTISHNHVIDQEEFDRSDGKISGAQINNIQINAAEHWPEENDRIFSLAEYKLKNPEISVVHSLNGHTYGKISGDISASVTEGAFEIPEEPTGGGNQPWNPFWGGHNNTGKTDGGGNNRPAGNTGGNDTNGNWHNRGCLGRLSGDGGCLKRLLWLILLGALLYWFFTSSGWGRQMICRFQRWRLQRELTEVREERHKLEDAVRKTKPAVSQCGGSEIFKGSNQQQYFTYTLGQTSGEVKIEYDMFDLPDRLEVIYNGELVAETNDSEITKTEYKYLENKGFADHSGNLIFNYKYKPNELHELTIRIIPNQDNAKTEWRFNVICP